jgi:penicillin-binding protein 1C
MFSHGKIQEFARILSSKLLAIYQNTAAWIRRRPRAAALIAVAALLWFFCLPRPLFDAPLSVVLEDRQGNLLGARIAADGQWRFPASEALPAPYEKCVVLFEDKRFWWHPGIDPASIARAIWQNIRYGRVVSGGSTLSMQVIRMARGNRKRTLPEKILEAGMATRLELTYSKREILGLYAANAPFGGNVVGLEAASWRFFGKKPELLSWAEAATLAVLPNSPSLIHPGRNRDRLLTKRNRLLERLRDAGHLDAASCALAKEEPLPGPPLALPRETPHLLDRLAGEPDHPTSPRFRTTIDRLLQQRVADILERRQVRYRGNEVHNLAAIVLDVASGEVLAYVGNAPGAGAEHGEQVDVIRAPRSTGSILKPYLYALSLENGTILPNSLLTDIPTQLGRYKPENYYQSYDGAVPARRALARSLNVPFVRLLRDYGIEKLHFELQQLGISTLNRPPGDYGLSLILGGAEASLQDVANTYACMARVLGNFYDRNGKYNPGDFRPPNFLLDQPNPPERLSRQARRLSAGAIWHTFEAMQEVERPAGAGEWELFETGRRVAWKTGTSFGYRDAWAVGVTPRFVVGVWVGNADGEGRPGLLGVDMAAPVLFEIFELLPACRWFDPPYDDMQEAAVCRLSGYRAGAYCPADTVWIPRGGLQARACPYHQLLHLDPTGQYQVHSGCLNPAEMQHVPWFVLPPLQEHYFKSKNPAYRTPPPVRNDCLEGAAMQEQNPMQLIYPKQPTKIYVPVELDGNLGSTVFQVAHRVPDTEIFWHLDGVYLGSTKTFHQMALQPQAGKHLLALVDANGFRLEQGFDVIGKK